MNPKVSVIIPAYNEEENLTPCLNSILKQTHKNFETIIIDNNSKDKTKKIIKEFSKKDKRIKYVFEKVRKRGAARKKGEKLAKGKIILMTDADCIVPTNWIKEMVCPILKNKEITVQGNFKPSKLNYWTEKITQERNNKIKARLADNKIGLLDTGNFAIEKNILKKIGYSNPNIFSGNDTELEIRLKKQGYKTIFKQIEVTHKEAETAKKVFKKFFYRGRWNKKIRKLNKKNNFNAQKNKTYFRNLISEVINRHNNLKYDVVSGFAWRLGGLFA